MTNQSNDSHLYFTVDAIYMYTTWQVHMILNTHKCEVGRNTGYTV